MELTVSELEETNKPTHITMSDGCYQISNSELEEDTNIINALELNQIREIIEEMNKFNQVEILRILQKNHITINENRYGIHINLTELKPSVINEIKRYIGYVNTQEKQLYKIEQQKETFINTYFQKR
jgi:hypothetical protein